MKKLLFFTIFLSITSGISLSFSPLQTYYRKCISNLVGASLFRGKWVGDTFYSQYHEGSPIHIHKDQKYKGVQFFVIYHEREDIDKILKMREEFKKGKYEFGQEELYLKEVELKTESILLDEQKDEKNKG